MIPLGIVRVSVGAVPDATQDHGYVTAEGVSELSRDVGVAGGVFKM